MPPMYLTINKPCQKDWNSLSPTEQGKFCTSCQREVIDFAPFSLSEIKQFLEQQEGELCGSFYASQMDAFNKRYQPFPTSSRVKQWAAAAVLTAVVTLPSFGQTNTSLPHQETNIITSSPKIASATTQQSSKAPTIVLSGRVLDPTSKEPLVAAIVWVKGTEISSTTDAQGFFSLRVPPSEEAIAIDISLSGYTTMTHQIVPNKKRTGLVIAIKPIAPIEAKEVIVEEKTVHTRKKRRPRRRLWGKRIMGCPAW